MPEPSIDIITESWSDTKKAYAEWLDQQVTDNADDM